jgi:hypothetical protein
MVNTLGLEGRVVGKVGGLALGEHVTHLTQLHLQVLIFWGTIVYDLCVNE